MCLLNHDFMTEYELSFSAWGETVLRDTDDTDFMSSAKVFEEFMKKYKRFPKSISLEVQDSSAFGYCIHAVDTATYNKISRMLTHILCSFTKEENKKDINYIRVLGFSSKGRKYLNKIKKEVNIPIITNVNKENIKLLDLELRVDNIYNLITNRNDNLYAKRPINY